MEKLTKNFIEDPNEETFSLIEISSFALNEVFKRAPNLADQFFQFNHWYRIYREANSSPLILSRMQNSEKTFDDAFKLHYSLGYDERKKHEPRLIELANTVKELTSTLHLIGNKYRKEIVEKMREIAVTDEDKKTVSFYHI